MRKAKNKYVSLLNIVTVFAWGGTTGICRQMIRDGLVLLNGSVCTSPYQLVGVGDIVDCRIGYIEDVGKEHIRYFHSRGRTL